MGNSKKSAKGSVDKWGERVETKFLPKGEGHVPLSLIIPVYNCSEVIGETLESVQRQNYPTLEVIVIDAGSEDRTLDIVNSYAAMITRVYTVANFNMADMFNRGVSLASGDYIAALLPGSLYLSDYTYQAFADEISHQNYPDLLYCGSIQREVKREPRTIYLPFDPHRLERGQQPATLPACWFRKDLFERVGKLNIRYQLRAGYDFFCRIALEENICSYALDRVYVDFDYGRFSYGKAFRYTAETWRIIHAHFGLKKALKWFFTIYHLVMLRWMYRKLKQLFSR